MPFRLEDILRCPVSGSRLHRVDNDYVSGEGRRYPIVSNVPVLLAPRETSTLWVADASLHAATTNPLDEWQEDTIGVSPSQLAQLKKRLEVHRREPERIDPIISFLVGATCGHMYAEQTGRLKVVPIPKIRLPAASPNALLLDIGCNWGRWSIAAAKLGYEVVGIDPSLGAVLAAKRLARDLDLDNVHFVVADALQLPFAAEVFDVVFSYSVLQHFSPEDAVTTIKQAAAVSKTDARLSIQMANRFGLRSLFHQWRRRFRAAKKFEVRYYSPLTLLDMFSRNYGTSSLSVDGFFGLGIQAALLPDASVEEICHRGFGNTALRF